MRLHLLIGFDGPGSTATPTVLYCGNDADAARDVMAKDTVSYRFLRVQNPVGVRKENVNYSEQPSAPDAPASPAESSQARKRK